MTLEVQSVESAAPQGNDDAKEAAGHPHEEASGDGPASSEASGDEDGEDHSHTEMDDHENSHFRHDHAGDKKGKEAAGQKAHRSLINTGHHH